MLVCKFVKYIKSTLIFFLPFMYDESACKTTIENLYFVDQNHTALTGHQIDMCQRGSTAYVKVINHKLLQ